MSIKADQQRIESGRQGRRGRVSVMNVNQPSGELARPRKQTVGTKLSEEVFEMKLAKLGVAIAALAIAMAPALAFHDGGVAHCNGCHTMHNSQNGAPMNGTTLDGNGDPTGGLAVGNGYADLLLFPNKTDVCLSCHAGNGSATTCGRPTSWPRAQSTAAATSSSSKKTTSMTATAAPATRFRVRPPGTPSPPASRARAPIPICRSAGRYLSVARPELRQLPRPARQRASACSTRTASRRRPAPVRSSTWTASWTPTVSVLRPRHRRVPTRTTTPTRSGYSDWCADCHGDFHAAARPA